MQSLLLSLLVWASAPSARAPSAQSASKAPATRKLGKKGGKGGRGKAGRDKAGRGKSGKARSAPHSTTDLSVLLSRSRYRQAMRETTRRLAEAPFGPELHASRVVCCSEFGDYPCVMMSIHVTNSRKEI